MFNIRKNIFFTFALSLVVGLSVSAAQAQVQNQQQTNQAETYKLVGQVVDANTGEALPGVEVKITEAQQGQTQTETQIETQTGMGNEEGEMTETTNDQGQFTFMELPSGEHTITIEQDGYEKWERMINLNQDSQLTIELQPTR